MINKPIEEVIRLISDVNNLREWQPGLESFETFEGTQGMEGAKSKLLIKHRGRTMELVETIIKRDFKSDLSGVNEYSATYESNGVFNVVKNYFERIDENTTKYSSYNEFEFHNIIMKVFSTLFPWIFKKESMTLLENFKNFAEGNIKNPDEDLF